MTPRRFAQVDVFTARPLFGNPVAVILDGEGLTDAQMQQTAQWTNLSETTFVLPPTRPEADYRVRIFTPTSELPFAGHPTLGTAHAVTAGGIATPSESRLVQECAVGLVDLTIGDAGPSFRLPRYARVTADGDAIAAILGVGLIGEAATLDVGPHWIIAKVADVTAIRPDLPRLADHNRRTGTTGLTIYADTDEGIAVRSFAPDDNVPEDPVCGSGNGAVAAFRLLNGEIGPDTIYTATQGREIGRDGVIAVRIEGDDIHIGGRCVTVIEGNLTL